MPQSTSKPGLFRGKQGYLEVLFSLDNPQAYVEDTGEEPERPAQAQAEPPAATVSDGIVAETPVLVRPVGPLAALSSERLPATPPTAVTQDAPPPEVISFIPKPPKKPDPAPVARPPRRRG